MHQGGMHLGKISKPHGIKGALNLIVNPDAARYVEQDNPLFIEIDGQRVPFFITDVQEVADDHLIVRLEFIQSLEEAKTFTGRRVYLDINLAPFLTETDPGSLIGFRVMDAESGFQATVVDFIDQKQNRILVMEYKNREVMVPMADEVIRSIDNSKRLIELRLPDGLIDLND